MGGNETVEAEGQTERDWKSLQIVLKVEEGDTTPRMWVTSRSWEKSGHGFSPGTPKRNQPCWRLDFISPVNLISDFWPPELEENTFVSFQVPTLW